MPQPCAALCCPRTRPAPLSRAFLSGALLGIVACGGAPSSPSGNATLAIVGRAERGSSARAVLVRGADTLAVSPTSVTVQPQAAATVASDGSITFLSTGPLTITAAATDGTTASATVVVAAPPSIVFDMVVDGNRDIYSVALDGVGLTKLTTSPADDSHPSAAGGIVVFSSTRDGNGELYALTLATMIEQRITATSANETDPVLSPDGHRTAYVSDAAGPPRVTIAAADGTGAAAVSLKNDASVIEASPSWAPASDRIAYMSTAAGGADIDTADVGGAGTVFASASSRAADVEPAWSTDGKSIAFASNRDGPTELYRATVASGVVTRLTQLGGSVAQPAWLPDGRIVFTMFTPGPTALYWLDPSDPSIIHRIVTGSGVPGHPAPVR